MNAKRKRTFMTIQQWLQALESKDKECPEGVSCLSTDIFHYRDFRHEILAAYRASSDFVPPDIEIKPSPRKQKSPQKPRKRSTPRKKNAKSDNEKSRVNDNNVEVNGNESDSEFSVPSKKPRRSLQFSESPEQTPQTSKSMSKTNVQNCDKSNLESYNAKRICEKDRVNDNSIVNDNESDSEVSVPSKKPRRSLQFSESPGQTTQLSKLRSKAVVKNCNKNNLSIQNKEDASITSESEKQLQTTIEARLDSPTTDSSYSGYNPIKSSVNLSVSGDDNDNCLIDPPSSPEVSIPQRKSSHLLSSSSDSDIPLSQKLRLSLNNVTKIERKEKAGKVLRSSNKTSVHLNGFSLDGNCASIKKHTSAKDSDADSESGKSLVSSDVSFVPSKKSSSTSQTESSLSICSTDQLTTSSTSSTVSASSSSSVIESRSSDPSYSEDYDIPPTSSPRKMKTSVKPVPTLSEEFSSASSSSSSQISKREKLLFGDKKLSPKKFLPKNSKGTVNVKKVLKASTLRLFDTSDSDDKSEWRSLVNRMRNGCYPSDLKIDSEDTLTTVSSCSGSDTSQATALLPPRQCPFYKRIPDTPFAVDAFQYWNIPGVKIYFLSHFHSDHYIGLKKSFSHPISCTQITANLVRMKLRVEEKWLRVVDLDQPQIISGVEVTALDANHCPGSVMFLFSLTNGRSYLHVGDFRASRAMTFYPSLKTVSITKLFLDTTYCSPQYCFPTQEEVIAKVVEIVRNQVKTHPKTLVVCGSYTIGKEKVFLGVAEALDWRIWARPEKQRVFNCLNDPRINSRLVKDFRSANVHVLPMASLQIRNLGQHLQSCMGEFSHVIGIKPTGWELNTRSDQFKVTSRDNVTIYGVPYSEHSSFTELRDFVQFLQPHEVVATVNVGSSASRAKMNKYFSDWLTPTSTTQTDGKSEKQTKVSQYFKTSS